MCGCICAHLCTCMYMCILHSHVCMHMCVCICMCVSGCCVYLGISTYVYLCMCACMCTRLYVNIYIYIAGEYISWFFLGKPLNIRYESEAEVIIALVLLSNHFKFGHCGPHTASLRCHETKSVAVLVKEGSRTWPHSGPRPSVLLEPSSVHR